MTTHPHPALSGLPEPMLLFALELLDLDLPTEVRADCARCPLAAPTEAEMCLERPFLPDIRCCTFHPNLPNFLVGRALARGGTGARLIRERIATGEGLLTWGVHRTEAWDERYQDRRREVFGKDRSLACPYWTPGPLGCGVWLDRAAVCRTWFCRHVDGRRGHELWSNLRRLIRYVELRLALFCIEQGRPAEEQGPEEWEAWYRWCAERVEAMNPVELAELADTRLDPFVDQVLADRRAHHPPLPEVVIPAVQDVQWHGDRVFLVGYSEYDARWLDRSVFALLSRLDGRTPWRQALDQANAELDEPLPASLVEDLWRADALEEAGEVVEHQPGWTVRSLRLEGRELLVAPVPVDDFPLTFLTDGA